MNNRNCALQLSIDAPRYEPQSSNDALGMAGIDKQVLPALRLLGQQLALHTLHC